MGTLYGPFHSFHCRHSRLVVVVATRNYHSVVINNISVDILPINKTQFGFLSQNFWWSILPFFRTAVNKNQPSMIAHLLVGSICFLGTLKRPLSRFICSITSLSSPSWYFPLFLFYFFLNFKLQWRSEIHFFLHSLFPFFLYIFSMTINGCVTKLIQSDKFFSLVSYYWLLLYIYRLNQFNPDSFIFLLFSPGQLHDTQIVLKCKKKKKSKTNVVILSFRLLYKPFVACHACPCLFFFPSHFDNFFFRAIQTRNLFFCLCGSTGKSSSSHTLKEMCVCIILKDLYIYKKDRFHDRSVR